MSRKLWILLLIILSGMLTACGQDGRYQVIDELMQTIGRMTR